VLATLVMAALAAAPAAEPPFRDVLAAAAASGKPVFLDVYTTWCGPCRALEKDVLPAPDVKRALEGYRYQRYDAEKGAGIEVAHRFDVRVYPSLLVVTPDGVLIARLHEQTVDGLARALDEWRPFGAARGLQVADEAAEGEKDPAVLLARGVVADRAGRSAQARALYDRVEALDPGDQRGLASRAAFRKLKQDLAKAFVRNKGETLLAFAGKYPGGELAARAVGYIQFIAPVMRPPAPRLREVGKAVADGLAARKDHLALDGLAWALDELGFPDLALEAARAAQAAAPYDLQHVITEAAARDAAGAHDEAVALLQKGLKVDPRHARLREALALAQRGRPLRPEHRMNVFTDEP
jgi:tetratricopeptide (TPR) repeat protein